MADLIGLDEAGVMLRPCKTDLCVVRRAVELALPVYKEYGYCEKRSYSDVERASMLAEVIGAGSGFHICRLLKEKFGLSPDDWMVSAMGEGFIDEALEELTAQWVRCLGIRVWIPVGAKVLWRGEQGLVVGADAALARYHVRLPRMNDRQHLVVDSESALLTLVGCMPVDGVSCTAMGGKAAD